MADNLLASSTLAPPYLQASNDGRGQQDHRGLESSKMRVLSVLSSSNQLYSGIGRNVFELSLRLSDRVDFEFVIDDLCSKNLELLLEFGAQHGFAVHVGRGRAHAHSPDAFNVELPTFLRQRRWDVIECLCWANAATNAFMLGEAGTAILCYTPHYQPLWSVPMSSVQAAYTEAVHARVLQRADVVFCVSAWERRELQDQAGQRGHCVFLPNGCHFEDFRPGLLVRRPQLLFVGDLAEPRKRIDRVLAVFARLRQRRPQLRLVLVGSRTEEVRDRIPPELHSACELRGYVSEQELRHLYTESQGLLLLSDCEAFGMPILEALVCGTPVFLSYLESTYSLFGSFSGAHFCPVEDLDRTVAVIEQTLDRGPEAITEVLNDRERLRAAFDWDMLAAQKWQALASAWFLKNHWAA